MLSRNSFVKLEKGGRENARLVRNAFPFAKGNLKKGVPQRQVPCPANPYIITLHRVADS